MVKINDVELDFDLLDADTMDRYESALGLLKGVKTAGLKTSDVIRAECSAVFAFFDAVFGDGKALAVFGGRTNLGRCVEAVETIALDAAEQNKKFEETMRKFAPPAR